VTGDEASESGLPRTPAEFAAQLHAAADKLMSGWTGTARPALPPPVLPATLSTQQLQAVVADIAARRAQVQTLRTQLGAFEEQLEALEANLRPLLEWTQTWAGVEGAMTNLWRPGGQRPADG
jgi:hypothetical protein